VRFLWKGAFRFEIVSEHRVRLALKFINDFLGIAPLPEHTYGQGIVGGGSIGEPVSGSVIPENTGKF
jgi:hypothetical protein